MDPLTASEADRVAAAIVADRLGDLPVPLLTRTGLGALAFVSSGAASRDASLVQAYAAMMMHHRTTRREVRPLLAAWRDAGVQVLVFKGFHLAEWVYDDPAERLYGDVDLLVRARDVSAAAAVAVERGWTMPWVRPAGAGFATTLSDRRGFKHEAFHLVSRSGVTQLDVHRLAVPCASPFDAVQHRITDAVWAEGRTAHLDGVPLRVLGPADTILVGLVLNRFWSPDDLTLKPHDYVDIVRIVQRYRLTAEDVAQRAADLGCARTWRLFLRRCDPWRQRLTLKRPALPARQAYLAGIALERPHPQVEDLLMRFVEIAASRASNGSSPMGEAEASP